MLPFVAVKQWKKTVSNLGNKFLLHWKKLRKFEKYDKVWYEIQEFYQRSERVQAIELEFVRSPRQLVSFMLFHNFENVSNRFQIDDIASSVQFSRNYMHELKFVPNRVSSINITLVTPVELSYDFCGFSNFGFMFYEYINYCHLITVWSILLSIEIW